MPRAEELKDYIQKKKSVGKLHKTIKIGDNQVGYSYSTVFSKYINEKLTKVTVHDDHVKNHQQRLNFLRFCELLIRKAKSLKTIQLITTRHEANPSEQEAKLQELNSSLQKFGCDLTVEFSDTVHDREITFDNGWVIKIDRGLDYFKSPSGMTSVGFCDFDFRECHETGIDVFDTKREE